MLDQVIDNIIQKIRKEVVKPGMESISLSYLKSRDIPNSVKHFFDQEVELWLREEAEKFTSSERFDYEMPEVRVLIDKIFDILKQSATFHLTQFNRLLERAIKLEANYLIRPHQTLTQFLFKDNFVVTTMEVYDMLKYFDKFQYYKDALTDYFNLKYLREISQTQFEELIAGIDDQVYGREMLETSLKTIKTIINFLNEGRTQTSDTIDTETVLTAFSDRNLTEFGNLIAREIKDGTKELTFQQLESILKSGKTLKELASHPVATAKPLEQVEDIETSRPEVEVETIAVSEKTEEPRVIEMEEQVEVEEEEEEEEEVETSAADQLADVVAAKIKGDVLVDLNHMITKKQRKKFVKKIFHKSEQHFEKFLRYINQTDSWKTASSIIDESLAKLGINPYSREALELSDLIYNRYFPKDSAGAHKEF